ncbi:MAG: phage tail protein [Proteobacteria bacterium]|nr:phage tail protein [Pseudomonadota bacterium]
MPSAVAWIATKAIAVVSGSAFSNVMLPLAVTAIGNAVAQVAALATIDAGIRRLTQKSSPSPDQSRQVVVRSAIQPKTIIYGEALVGGLLTYMNVAGTNNQDLYILLTLSGHEVSGITDVWLDNTEIASANINWGTDGKVTAGTFADYAWFFKKLGTSSQTVITEFNSSFTDIDSGHKGIGCALLGCRFRYAQASAQAYEAGPPGAIRALVQGKLLYDPRLDSTVTGGGGAHRVADPTTWAWSDNPALCVADYLIDSDLGMGFDPAEIDYESLIAEADYCDETVSVPGGTEKRFTCNGTLVTGKHKPNVESLLASMNGRMSRTNGKFRIRAGRYVTPTITLDESWLRGDISVRTATPKAERFNTVRATYFDPDQSHKKVQTADCTGAAYVSRDNGETLYNDINLSLVNSSTEAQRIALKRVYATNQQKLAIVPCNYKALQVGMHDHIQCTISELNWSSKVFRVVGWTFNDMSGEGGIDLVLREDASTAYADPDLGDYTTTSAGGNITFGSPGVPAASGLTATAKEGGILVEWTNPTPASTWDVVELYASADSAWANAVKIAEGRIDKFFHKLDSGETRYYWVKVFDDEQESIRDPDADTSGVSATATDSLGTAYTAATNFDARNDRDGSAVTAPTIAADETALDHVVNTDGSVDMSFEWLWGGIEADIDGFRVVIRASSSATSYNIGTTPAEESVFDVPADQRAYSFLGLAADKYYTVGVQAYRVVDPDVDSSGLLSSAMVQPSHANEDPYQPDSNVAFAGDLTGTIQGAAAGALANQDTADFGTDVVGATKPADNATNNGATIDTSGNITGAAEISSGAIYVGKANSDATTAGIWIGTDGTSAYDLHVGDGTSSIKWDGSAGTLTVTGTVNIANPSDIDATAINNDASWSANGATIDGSGNIVGGIQMTGSGTITLSSAGHIKGGQTAYDTGTGFFLGYSGGAYKFSIGAAAGDKMIWDGSTLTVTGDLNVQNASTVRSDINVEDGSTAGAGDLGEVTARNTNFEAGDVYWTHTTGFSIAAGNAHQGSNSLQCTGVVTATSRNDVYYPTASGERFLFGGYIKTSAGAAFSSAGIRVNWYDSAKSPVSSSTVSISSANTSYAMLIDAGVAPATVEFARLEAYVISPSSGTIYFDDLFMAPMLADALIDALQTTNAPAEADADVTVPDSGTFLPELWDDSLSGSESQTYSYRSGYYKQLASDLMFARWVIHMSSLGTLTTTQQGKIGNLPATGASVASPGDCIVGFGIALSGSRYGAGVTGYVGLATNYIRLGQWIDEGGGTVSLSIGDITASGILYGTVLYRI